MPPPIWTPYCGSAPDPAEFLGRWNFDPWLLAVLADVAFTWRGRLGWSAVGLAVLIFVSPLCALSSAMFSARVVHHALLVLALAPMLAWGPMASWRIPLAAATILQALALWFWHAPPAYAWALSHDGVYWTMQITLVGSAALFWSAVRASPAPAGFAALLGTMMQTGLLGALITFAAQPLYAPHLTTTSAWGLSALTDQQLAGLIMWAPMAGLYLLAALTMFGRWLAQEARQA